MTMATLTSFGRFGGGGHPLDVSNLYYTLYIEVHNAFDIEEGVIKIGYSWSNFDSPLSVYTVSSLPLVSTLYQQSEIYFITKTLKTF